MNVVLMTQDIVGPNMAGPGIRYWELAQTLSDEFAVTLLGREGSTESPTAVKLLTYTWGDTATLRSAADQADVVIINSFLLGTHPELSATTTPVVVDLYDPFPIENLVHFADHDAATQARSFAENQAWLRHSLVRGDFFVCATPRQRDLWIGTLLAHGRINPATLSADPLLRQLITLLPSGLPAAPPPTGAPVLKGVWPGIAADDQVILWSGGIWDWLDPLTVIQAMPLVLAEQPRARLVFLGRGHPTPGVADAMHMPARAQRLAQELGLLDQTVFFNPGWVPYAERGQYLIEADVAISLHHHSLESEFAAVRSRVLDHLWAGLPSVLTNGDPASLWLEPLGAALSVAPGDPAGVAAALVRILNDPAQQAAMATAARAAAASVTWPHVSAKLRAFCQQPHRAADADMLPVAPEVAPAVVAEATPAPSAAAPQVREAAPAPSAAPPAKSPAAQVVENLQPVIQDDSRRNAAMQRLEALWNQISAGGGWRKRLRRWLGGAASDDAQQAFNAAMIQALYELNESRDQRRSFLLAVAQQAQAGEALQALTERHERAEANLRMLNTLLDAQTLTRLQAMEHRFLDLPEDTHPRLLRLEEDVRTFRAQAVAHLQVLEDRSQQHAGTLGHLAPEMEDARARLLRAEEHLRSVEPRLVTSLQQLYSTRLELLATEESLSGVARVLTELRLAALPTEEPLA